MFIQTFQIPACLDIVIDSVLLTKYKFTWKHIETEYDIQFDIQKIKELMH